VAALLVVEASFCVAELVIEEPYSYGDVGSEDDADVECASVAELLIALLVATVGELAVKSIPVS
jgi:hypothetical protein